MSTERRLAALRLRAVDRPRSRLALLAGEHLVPLVLFSMLSIVLTWPLLLHFGIAAPTEPGETAQDLWEKLWNLWWLSEALRRRVNPFFTDMLFYPTGASLLYHPLNPANALLGLPAYIIGGPIASYNTVVLLSFVLSGYGVYLLARRYDCGRGAALVGGLVYTASSFHFFHLRLNHLELISIQWLPLYVLALDAVLRRPSPGRAIMAAGVMLLTMFTSLYLALYAALLTALWVTWLVIARWREPRALVRPLLGLAGTVLLVLLIAGPVLLVPMAREARTSDYMIQSVEQAAWRAAGPFDIVLPPAGYLLHRLLPLPLPQSDSTFLGLVPVVLAVVGGILRLRQSARWLVLAVVAWLLSLGPAFPPYRLVFSLRLLQVSRYPDRLGLLTLLSVAVLAAFGVEMLMRRIKGPPALRRMLAVVPFGLVLLELYTAPKILTYPFDNPFYHTLAQDHERFSVIELPIGRNNSAWLDMFAQTLHHHPIPNGTLARKVPRIPYEWLPVIQQLEHPDLPDDILVQTAEQRAAALRFFDLRYLVYHRENEDGPVTPPAAEDLTRVSGVPVRQVYSDEQLVGYRFDLPPGPANLPPVARLGEGWQDLELPGPDRHRWLQDGDGTVEFYAIEAGPVTIRINALAFNQSRGLDVYVDDQQVGHIQVEPWLSEVAIPPVDVSTGSHILRLHAPDAGMSPRDAGLGDDDRVLSVGIWSLEIESQ